MTFFCSTCRRTQRSDACMVTSAGKRGRVPFSLGTCYVLRHSGVSVCRQWVRLWRDCCLVIAWLLCITEYVPWYEIGISALLTLTYRCSCCPWCLQVAMAYCGSTDFLPRDCSALLGAGRRGIDCLWSNFRQKGGFLFVLYENCLHRRTLRGGWCFQLSDCSRFEGPR